MPLRDKILRALYGGAIVTGTLGAAACADDTPEDESGWNVNEPGNTSTNNTSTVENNTTVNNDKANNTVTENSFEGPCADDAQGLTQLPYEGWQDDPDKINPGVYVVCADPAEANCDFPQSNPGEVTRFLYEALGPQQDCRLTWTYANPAQGGICGPLEHAGDECCFVIDISFYDGCALNIGRPFTVDGSARFANVARRDGWCEEITLDDIEALPEKLRIEIAQAWGEAGTHEHASIASFSRFMMDLMSLGAPRNLIEATTRAIADETRHATSCFSIASAFAGHPLGPEEVDVHGSMEHAGDEVEILRAAIEEGCVGETLAAAQAEWTIDKVRHPLIKQALEEIAYDEGEHALLAWRFVDWMLDARPHLIAVAKETFESSWMSLEDPFASGVSEREREALAHGHLSTPLERRIRARAFHHIVIPCADAMFARRGSGVAASWPYRAS